MTITMLRGCDICARASEQAIMKNECSRCVGAISRQETQVGAQTLWGGGSVHIQVVFFFYHFFFSFFFLLCSSCK